MKALTLCLCLAAAGCAGAPQQDFLTQASHFLSSAQDIQQRALKVYNALCAGREDAVECVEIRQKVEAAFGITLDQMFAQFDSWNKAATEVAK